MSTATSPGAGALMAVLSDDEAFLALMERTLRHEGYRVELYRDEDVARAGIPSSNCAMVIFDLAAKRPTTSLLLLEYLRTSPATRHLPLILTSADAGLLDNHRAFLEELGCEVAPRPFDLEDVRRAVATCAAR